MVGASANSWCGERCGRRPRGGKNCVQQCGEKARDNTSFDFADHGQRTSTEILPVNPGGRVTVSSSESNFAAGLPLTVAD
jgi:hypothetical protein